MSVEVMVRRDHPTAEELVARAAAMIPVLRSREAATLKAGQVSAETISELQEAGFFRVLQPKRYGGYEMSPLAYGRIARALAEGCMSTAWVYAVVAVHNWELALFDDRAAQEVWGSDTNVRLCSSYMPVGRVTRVEGGYRLSGRWGFSSGSGHCDWVILGANIPSETPGAPPEPRNFLLPRADYQVLDNWDVMGLQGTGSNDILVENAFVPEYRTVRDQDLFDMRCPGHAINTAPLYKIPFAQIFNRTVSSTSLGALKHALDAFIEATRGRRTTYTGERLARDTSVQFTISEVERILDEQVLVMERDLSELLDRALANDWPLERRAALAAATTATVSRCVRGIDLLMEFSGAKALFRGNPIRQAFLDIHSARAHVANNPYPYGRNRGAMLLGIENDNQDI
ncbi:acyl-CoA dehydrogenase family protein [Niveispirillum sp. SYP-B3756]|uniref:acyl-CoA dehydrogenase family protein n=1 Tax=Niveispirillum sp. SYP-B3756 TaxID=2662178 RepID=UPI001B3C146A|nr:acyl-CoA dehydrogenase family protein [Niveispirillum sp. SYP-B3756]